MVDSGERPAGAEKGWCAQCVAKAYPATSWGMGWPHFWKRTPPQDAAMILVDTSVIVAWLDQSHEDHQKCLMSLEHWAGQDLLAVSSVTYGELAAGGRTREAVDEDLRLFSRIDLDFEATWRAGTAFCRAYPTSRDRKPVLPDFLIRGQAVALRCKHLTNDRRGIGAFPEIEFLFPEPT
jgi:predicted nucleic acid-binding protein